MPTIEEKLAAFKERMREVQALQQAAAKPELLSCVP